MLRIWIFISAIISTLFYGDNKLLKLSVVKVYWMASCIHVMAFYHTQTWDTWHSFLCCWNRPIPVYHDILIRYLWSFHRKAALDFAFFLPMLSNTICNLIASAKCIRVLKSKVRVTHSPIHYVMKCKWNHDDQSVLILKNIFVCRLKRLPFGRLITQSFPYVSIANPA